MLSFTTIVPILRLVSSCHMNTLSLLGFTKLSINLDKKSSVSARSFSVKKNISPSLKDNGIIDHAMVSFSVTSKDMGETPYALFGGYNSS